MYRLFFLLLGRAGEPANFLAAPVPAPDFFPQAAPAPGIFSSYSLSLANYSFPRKLVR